MNDAAADSVALPADQAVVDMTANIKTVITTQPAWTKGLEPLERPRFIGRDQGYVSVVVVLLLGLCLSFHTIKRLCGTLIKRLWNTRERDGYENITNKENRAIALQLLVAVFFIALLWNAALACWSPTAVDFTFLTTMQLAAIVAGYFIFEFFIYWIVSYTFTNGAVTSIWIEGFTSSMSLLGLTLIIPGLLVLFYPVMTVFAVIFSVVMYIAARIMFIYKGFRIFYTNLGSLVYFILYLCSLEIIPLAILNFLAIYFCGIKA